MTEPNRSFKNLSIEEQAAAWCLCIMAGDMDEVEQAKLHEWLAHDPQHVEYLSRLVAFWNAAGEQSQQHEMLRLREIALGHYRRAQQGRWHRPSFSRRAALASGLTLAVGLGAAGGAWFFSGETAYATGIGDRKSVILADSSRMTLDADSRVTVHFTEHARRLVLEKGRAVFDVAKDASRPFSVTSGNHTVIATGTSFSVEKLADQMQVILYEGHIRVMDSRGAEILAQGHNLEASHVAQPVSKMLAPNMQLTLADGDQIALVAPSPEMTPRAWEGGRLEFDDEPLSVAAERVNRYANSQKLSVAPEVATVRVSGAFNAGDTAVFAEEVASTFKLKLREDGQNLTLSRH